MYLWRAAPLLGAMCTLGLLSHATYLIFRREQTRGLHFETLLLTLALCPLFNFTLSRVLLWWVALPLGVALVGMWRHRHAAVGRRPVTDSLANLLLGALVAWCLWQEYRAHDPEGGVRLHPPLRGRVVVVQGGVTTWYNHHQSVREQRWALDLIRPVTFSDMVANLAGAPENNSTFGAEVFAPCSGEVIEARDDMPDQLVGETVPEVPTGNWIVLRCSDTDPAAIVRLAHLRHGSVRVRLGDQVRAGAFVAQVGNTGNTTGPHLHIDAQAAATAAGDAGRPLPMWFAGRFLRKLDVVSFAPPSGV